MDWLGVLYLNGSPVINRYKRVVYIQLVDSRAISEVQSLSIQNSALLVRDTKACMFYHSALGYWQMA